MTQAVDAPEKGRQRLAASGRRQQQRVRTRRDGAPAGALDGGRAGKRRFEPAAGRGLEYVQDVFVEGDG